MREKLNNSDINEKTELLNTSKTIITLKVDKKDPLLYSYKVGRIVKESDTVNPLYHGKEGGIKNTCCVIL